MIEHNKVQLASIEDLIPLMTNQLEKGGTVRFSPRGRSMLPMLRQDVDSVTLAPVTSELKKYDLPLYKRSNGKYVLHRIVRTGDTYSCIGDNQYFCENGITKEQIIAVVTSFNRGGKEYAVNDIRYRIYCRIWHYSRFPRRVLRGVKYRLQRLLERR